MLTKTKQDNMFGIIDTIKNLADAGGTIKAGIEGFKEDGLSGAIDSINEFSNPEDQTNAKLDEISNTLTTIANNKNMEPMKQDPMTGSPTITPGLTQSRSARLYQVSGPNYAQGSMQKAMKSNSMVTGVAQHGLMQKEEFDASKADRNKDGKVSDWEKASVKSFTK